MTPEIVELARQLAASTHSDIALAKTRDEHIRVTARANVAADLYYQLHGLLTGEVK